MRGLLPKIALTSDTGTPFESTVVANVRLQGAGGPGPGSDSKPG